MASKQTRGAKRTTRGNAEAATKTTANRSAGADDSMNATLQQLYDNEAPVNLGHGHTPSETINSLIERYGDDRVVKVALSIVKAADWADFIDIKNLAQFIATTRQQVNCVHSSHLPIIQKLKDDYSRLTRAFALCKKDCSAPLKAQFKQMLGYDRKAGAIKDAIKLITNHRELFDGIVSIQMREYKGWRLLALRTALFYIAAELDPANFDLIRNQLGGFYQGKIEGGQSVKAILSETHLLRNADFFTPACAYIKNADQTVVFAQSNNTKENISMVFTDCSGFVLNIMKILFP